MEHWAIWAAVSSEKQADDDKTSLPDQLGQGRAFIAGRGGAVVREFQVVHSRSDLLFEQAKREMPEYAALETTCTERAITHLWCRGWDRIARCEAVSGAVSYLLRSAGVQVYSARAGILTDPDTLAGALTSSIERIQAQQEIRELKRRYRDGIRGRVLGRGLHPNHWPTGYTPIRDNDGTVIGGELNDDAEAVHLITSLYLDGAGFVAIAKELTARAIPSPRGNPRWGATTVRAILANPFYAGYAHAGQVIAAEPSTAYPVLWDADTYRRIQARMGATKKGGKPPVSQVSGMAVCAECGYRMGAMSNRQGVRYFRCRTADRLGLPHSGPNYVREDVLITEVERRIGALATDEAIDALIAQEQGIDDDGQELERLHATVDQIQQQRVALGRQQLHGDVPGDVARELHLELSDRLEAAGQRIAELEQVRALAPSIEDRRASLLALRDLARKLGGGWLQGVPIPEARALLEQAQVIVYCKGGEIVG